MNAAGGGFYTAIVYYAALTQISEPIYSDRTLCSSQQFPLGAFILGEQTFAARRK